jgi:negative regulator of sigma E activity
MISDEMREILSAYVDGELRDADAARVEDVAKRDPELRREIEAYRTLRRKLKEWDGAEHAGAFPAAAVARVQARAAEINAALKGSARGRLFALLRPVAVAAGLLLAVGAGLLVSRAAPEAPAHPAPARVEIALEPLGPAPDLALMGETLAPAHAPEETFVRTRVHDHIPSRRALELAQAMREDELVHAGPTPAEPERRTVTPMSAEIVALTGGYRPAAAPSHALVVLARPPALSRLPTAGAAPLGPRLATDATTGEGLIDEELVGVLHDVVAPLGEVWIGAQDGSRRTRIVARSNWIPAKVGELTKVVWADDVTKPQTSAKLEVQDYILGPKARCRLLAATPGADAPFRDWLAQTYGTPLADAAKDGEKERERLVNRLVQSLEGDESASGFAVFDAHGALMGVEIFHGHDLMLAFAKRLLRGYLLEAGAGGIRLAAGGRGREEAAGFLKGLPGRGLRLVREPIVIPGVDRTNHAPEGLARANLVDAQGRMIGHGLVLDDAPVHLTLFGAPE